MYFAYKWIRGEKGNFKLGSYGKTTHCHWLLDYHSWHKKNSAKDFPEKLKHVYYVFYTN